MKTHKSIATMSPKIIAEVNCTVQGVKKDNKNRIKLGEFK